ncbi:MAG: hypothetical protein JW749_02315 [Sedimentisphaerales bacterium]|nr:hypothetical protein [Sedimentisphaerales bacterium]
MKNTIYMVIVLISFIVINNAKTEEQYWKAIKNYIIAYDKAKSISEDERISKEFAEYLDSLTAGQLIEAGRQCSEEGNASFQKKGFAEGTGFVISFFIARYPKTAGLENLQPIFKEIEDVNQTDMWRSTLIYAFKTPLWQKQLSDNQLREVADNIDKILMDKNTYYRVINESLYTTRNMLQEIENRNNVQKTLGEMNDVNNQIDKSTELSGFYDRFSKKLMSISSEPNLNADLQMVSFALMRDILNKPIDARKELENTLADAVKNYERYDIKTWRLLSQIGIEKLQLPDSNEIAKAMMDKLEMRIKNEPNNVTKRPLQSELESINRCTKKID